MFKQLSKSTKHFLRPFRPDPYNSLENTTLSIDLAPSKDKFVCQVFEEYEKSEMVRLETNLVSYSDSNLSQGTNGVVTKEVAKGEYVRKTQIHRRTPKHYEASQFASRFVHGHRLLAPPHTYHQVWECPTTDLSVALFTDVWPSNSSVYQTPAKKIVSERAAKIIGHIIAREQLANIAEMRSAAFFTKDELGLSQYQIDPNSELLPHQQCAAANAILMPVYALLMDMGTGKTATAIKKIKYLAREISRNNNRPAKILISCPKSILNNWLDELKKWLTIGNDAITYKPSVLTGVNEMTRMISLFAALAYDKEQSHTITSKSTGPNGTIIESTSVRNFENDAHIVIANYDAIVGTPCMWDKDQYAQRVEWDLIILDEAHNICNPGTDRCKAHLQLRDSSSSRLALTGTPVRNNPFDIWAIFEFLAHGLSGLDTHGAFKQFHGTWIKVPGKGISLLKSYENMAMMKERISKYSFSITMKEAAPYLPEITYDTWNVSMTDEQADFYNALQADLVAKFGNLDDENVSMMTVNNILTQMLRLAQITSGFAVMNAEIGIDEDGGPTGIQNVHRFDPNPKLDALIEIIKDEQEDDPNRKWQVWSCFKESIRHIKARLELEGLPCVTYHGDMSKADKDNSVYQFNCNRKMPIIIGTQAAGKEGLNLVGFDPLNPDVYETNCDRAIYFSNNWSGVDRAQSSKRAYRLITRVPVRITDLVVPRSIDIDIRDRILGKIDMVHSLRDLKKILTAVRYSREYEE